jgi:thymidylate synthase (FAD)
LCYKSFEVGLNKNVTKVREDSSDYFENILQSRHGSVLAHAHYSFVFSNVSRVFTHEIVRHAAGTDISQESLRFVRLDDIEFWLPDWVYEEGGELLDRSKMIVQVLESHQRWLAEYFHLDQPGVPFAEKKHKTSFMRRFAPEGLATEIGMTFNVRALRQILEMRYSEHAEEEMRVVMPQLFDIMKQECPLLFNDYTITPQGLQTEHRKVLPTLSRYSRWRAGQ